MKPARFGLRLEQDIADAIRRLARKNRRSISQTIVLILRDWLGKPDALK